MSTKHSASDASSDEVVTAPPVDDNALLHRTETEEVKILEDLKDGVAERRGSIGERSRGLDRTIFVVTGALVIAFLVWGFTDTDG